MKIQKSKPQAGPQIMGILNVTPDSFSDGGQFHDTEKATQQALKLIEAGADIIDIGGEASGPTSKDISIDEELSRVIPVIKAIRNHSRITISVDTYKAPVAEAALAAGANIINDITALRGDPQLAATCVKHGCPVVLMYSKDPSARTTIDEMHYEDVIADIGNFLQDRIAHAESQGIKPENIIIDPGMGHYISSLPRYSYEIITRLNELKPLAPQILIGLSRKSFLGGKITDRDESVKPLTAIAYLNGASIIRTHDVAGLKKFFDNF